MPPPPRLYLAGAVAGNRAREPSLLAGVQAPGSDHSRARWPMKKTRLVVSVGGVLVAGVAGWAAFSAVRERLDPGELPVPRQHREFFVPKPFAPMVPRTPSTRVSVTPEIGDDLDPGLEVGVACGVEGGVDGGVL